MLRRLLLGLALLALPAAAEAKGLKLVQNFPDFTSIDAVVTYNSTSDIFATVSTGVTYRSSLLAAPDYFLDAEYRLTAKIDSSGMLSPGGTLSIYDPTNDNLLLTGELMDFSLDDTVFNFLFQVKDGGMMDDFGGFDAMGGVIVTTFGVGKIDFTSSFEVGELNTQVDTFAVVPEPSTIVSLGLGLGGLCLGALVRRRKTKV